MIGITDIIGSMKRIHISFTVAIAVVSAPLSCHAQEPPQLPQPQLELPQQLPGTAETAPAAVPSHVIDVGTGSPITFPAQPGASAGSAPGATDSGVGQNTESGVRMVPTELLQQAAVLLQQRGNALKDLFTPQPQYPTSQSIMNPQPAAPPAGELNPLKGLFTPQPQYPTSQTIMNPHASPQDGEHNHFKGLFTPQPQYPTSQTIMNPEAEPRHLVPERVIKWPGASGLGGANTTPAEKANGKRGTNQSAVPPSAMLPATAPLVPPDASQAAPHPEAPFVKQLREAIVLMNGRHYGKSIETLTHILDNEPHNAQAHYIRAVNYVQMRKYAEAASDYKQVMTLQPNTVLSSMASEGLKKIGFSY